MAELLVEDEDGRVVGFGCFLRVCGACVCHFSLILEIVESLTSSLGPWHADEIYEAVCIWCEMGRSSRAGSTDWVRHRALTSDISYPAIHRWLPSRRGRHGCSETEPPLDAMHTSYGRCFTPRSGVAHTDPSSVCC